MKYCRVVQSAGVDPGSSPCTGLGFRVIPHSGRLLLFQACLAAEAVTSSTFTIKSETAA